MLVHHIDNYHFGEITINGISHTKDLIILPSHIITGWWRKEGHVLHLDDLEEVLRTKPRLLVIGQGAFSGMRVASEVEQALKAADIEWIALPTEKACQEFNLRAPEQVAAAALHLTC